MSISRHLSSWQAIRRSLSCQILKNLGTRERGGVGDVLMGMTPIRRSRLTKPVKVLAVIGIIAVGSVLFRSQSKDQDKVVALPLILKQVQGMGELHTSRYQYQNVLEYSTHREPTEWAKNVPILADAVRSTTGNSALVSVHGEVQAGFDLDKATVSREEGKLVVTLPSPEVYPARVEAQVHNTRRGVFWRDDNIGLKAERDAAVRFRNASIKQGIESHAKQEVTKRVVSLLGSTTKEPIEVRIL